MDVAARRLELLLTLGRYAEAEAAAREAVAADPESPTAYGYLAQSLVQLGRAFEGVEVARLGVDKAPGSSWHHSILGMAWHALGQLDEAATAYHEARRLDPVAAHARAQLGWFALARGASAAALMYAQEGLAFDPTDGGLLQLKATAEVDADRPDDAEATVLDALARDPNRAAFHHLLGRLYRLRAGRLPLTDRLQADEAAVRAFAAAVRLDPTDVAYRAAHESALADIGRTRSATGRQRPPPTDWQEQMRRIVAREEAAAAGRAAAWVAEFAAAADPGCEPTPVTPAEVRPLARRAPAVLRRAVVSFVLWRYRFEALYEFGVINVLFFGAVGAVVVLLALIDSR